MNIILIISDTFRYDNLFDRAAMPVRTPCLDEFSKRAVSCSRMYVSSFPTIPHRTDLTSGRFGWPWYPWQPRRLGTQNHSPEILRKAGYVSQLICDCPHLFRADFNVGFDGAHAIRGQEGDVHFLHMNTPFEEMMPPEKTRSSLHFGRQNLSDLSQWINPGWRREIDRFPPRTAGLAMEFLEENYRHDPFFLWVDFFDPHEPWDPPEYMVKRYDPDYDGVPMIHPNYGKASVYTEAELKNLRAHYCAEAELVDRWVGRVLQKIDDLQLWENSVIVFTSDHGMSLGEHDRTGKSWIHTKDSRCWPLYSEIAHIPFMVAAPGLEGGREIDAFVQPPDILPTVMELAGAEAEPPEPFHGRSFAAHLKGGKAGPVRDFVVSSHFMREAPKPVDDPAKRGPMTPALYTDEWCYAPWGPGGETQLFAITDTDCEKNVASDNAGVVEELHAKLVGWMKEMDAPAEAMAPFE